MHQLATIPNNQRVGAVFDREPLGSTSAMRWNIADLVGEWADSSGGKTALRAWDTSLSYVELRDAVRSMKARLAALGVERGHRVGLLGRGGPEWAVGFFATLALGAVAVPLDGELGDETLISQLDRARAPWLLASVEIVPRAELLMRALGGVVLEMSAAARGSAVPTLEPLGDRVDEGSPALVCFTSGTTGKPKGVVITHGNLRFQVDAFAAVFPRAPRTLAMLPPHHLFGLTVDLLGCLSRGGTAQYCPSLLPHDFQRALTWAKPNCIVTVPRFLMALSAAVRREMGRQPRALRVVARALLAGGSLMKLHAVRRLVAWPLRRGISAGLETFIVGGAPTDAASAGFFEALGITVLGGYGLSEASPVVSFNTPGESCPGSVGRPLPGVEIRCLADGEVVTRGPHVMAGYLDDPIGTSLVIDPLGWLRTGDLGRIDADGFLHLYGRRKDLVVLATGRKVHPDTVEPALFATRLVAEGVVLGAPSRREPGAQEVVAVVVPAAVLASLDVDARQDAIRNALVATGQQLARYERPTRIVLHSGPLPRTATGKVQRDALSRWLGARS